MLAFFFKKNTRFLDEAYISFNKTCHINSRVLSFIGKSAIILELWRVQVDNVDFKGLTQAQQAQPEAGCHRKCLFNVISRIIQTRLTAPIGNSDQCEPIFDVAWKHLRLILFWPYIYDGIRTYSYIFILIQIIVAWDHMVLIYIIPFWTYLMWHESLFIS